MAESGAPKPSTVFVVSASAPTPVRLLSRKEAARYTGFGATKFSALVTEGRMPKPLQIDSCRRWDIHDLDRFIDDLPAANDDVETNSWNDVV